MAYKCPKCGNDVVEGSKFCSNCAQQLSWTNEKLESSSETHLGSEEKKTQFCPICKSEISGMPEKCPICKSNLHWETNKAVIIGAERPKSTIPVEDSNKFSNKKPSRITIDIILFIVMLVVIGIALALASGTETDYTSTTSTTKYVSPGITGEYYYREEIGEIKIKIKNGAGETLKISFDGNDLMGIPGNVIQWESTLWYVETINGLKKYECWHSGYDEYYWFFDESNHTLSYGDVLVLQKE